MFTTLPNNPSLYGLAEVVDHIIYSESSQMDLSLILPWDVQAEELPTPKRPLIVFVQGSSWQTPNFNYELPQLSRYAQEGYIVATVRHRSTGNGFPFPAYLVDVKCAIRFLRANAERWGIDPERVLIWGTSSGGNTAELVGLTGDDPAYRNGEYEAYSDAVCAVVACFAPANLNTLFEGIHGEGVPQDVMNLVTSALGADQDAWEERMREFSPTHRVEEGKTYPPYLLLHGDADPVVPYGQSVELAERLEAAGVEVRGYRVEGAIHEGNFWSAPVRDTIHDFIEEKLA